MQLSIIVPSFNQGRFLARTLDSILAQDYRPYEVIVVDGASTDNTLDVLREYASQHAEIRWLSAPDRGPAEAVNKGLALARGEIAAIQSADDLYCEGAFSAVMETMAKNPECGFLIGHYRGIDEQGRYRYTWRAPEFSWEAYFGMALCIPQSSIFFRMSVARQVGGWNPEYYCCDLDYWLRLLLNTRALRLDRILSEWRLHAGGRTHRGQQARIWTDYRRMILDNAQLWRQSAKLSRLARASRHIICLHFHPTREPWAMRWHLLAGGVLHPAFWRYQDRREILKFMPGYRALRWLYHKALAGYRRVATALAARYRRYDEAWRIWRRPSSFLVRAFARSYPAARFVQIGSNDGVKTDPLHEAIRTRAWRGLMVEPVPFVFERLRARYGDLDRIELVKAAIAERDGSQPFYYLREAKDPAKEGLPFWYDELGSFRKEVILSHAGVIPDVESRIVEEAVPCLTFDSLCRRHELAGIDLLHMDTEGYDAVLLRSIDFSRYRPRLLIYEHIHLSYEERKACAALLSAQGYELLDDVLDTVCLNVRDCGRTDRALLRLWRVLRLMDRVRNVAWWLRTPKAPDPARPVIAAGAAAGARAPEPLDLACAADANYIPHCAAMLHSVLTRTPELRARVHFLHEPGLPAGTLLQLRGLVESHGGEFHPTAVPDAAIEGLFATADISRVAWYRTLLPGLRPDLGKVLYLDCDTLVIDSLKPLWEVDIEGYFVAAVRNVIAPELATRHHALGLPESQPYFNSGVLLMNLESMRREGCTARILEHARTHDDKLIWVDQDSLNLVLGPKCRFLHPRWNCQTSVFYWPEAEEVFGRGNVAGALEHPAIVHFEGPELSKPWNYLCVHPYQRHYYHHLAAAGWPATPPAGRNWRRALLRLLPMRIVPHALAFSRRLKAAYLRRRYPAHA